MTKEDHEHMTHPHEQMEHDEGHHDCPDQFHRCHTRTVSYGYTDCPDEHCEPPPKMVSRFLKIDCGGDDPTPQIMANLALPGNFYDLVASTIDLGHGGWIVVFNHPE